MSSLDNYEAFDAVGLAELVARREVSPAELLEATISRVEALNPKLNAVVTPLYEEARASLEAGLPEGPLRGVPFLLKDLGVHYAGSRMTSGSRFFEDFVSDHDSELTARYKRAGLVVLGRTATPELGITTTTESRLFGQTRNPWSPEYTCGGSSGGAAAAVAAGMVPSAHASDGGGSIRVPASCCGVFGLKPTRARVSLAPDAGESWSGMSTVHAITRSVRDSAALLDATHGPASGDPYWAPPPERRFSAEIERPPGKLRIALQTQTFSGAETHPDCVTAAADAAKLCAELGHEVEERALVVDRQRIAKATSTIVGASLLAALQDRAEALGRPFDEDDVEPATYRMARQAESADAASYARAIRNMHVIGRQVAAFFERYDLLLTPTMATPPLPLGSPLTLSHPDPREHLDSLLLTIGYTQLFNAAGNPAMSVPLHWNAEGLPIGVQFAGRFGDEATLFQLAAELEKARPWFDRRPTL
jgi:Asp-tRNA(Asn)/Glu-tRNA(Gln) amidotransferase A subunit family amidase